MPESRPESRQEVLRSAALLFDKVAFGVRVCNGAQLLETQVHACTFRYLIFEPGPRVYDRAHPKGLRAVGRLRPRSQHGPHARRLCAVDLVRLCVCVCVCVCVCMLADSAQWTF